jgi:hypothetical protein
LQTLAEITPDIIAGRKMQDNPCKAAAVGIDSLDEI